MFKKIVHALARLVKGGEFYVDSRISSVQLFKIICIYAFRGVRGFFRFKKLVFVGSGVSLNVKSKIKYGKSLSLGDGCVIDALSVDGVVFGDRVSIQKGVVIECTGSIRTLGKGLVVGNNVGVGAFSYMGCAGGVEIGNDTIIGNYASFHSENHNFDRLDLPISKQGVSHIGIKVGDSCWIGAKVTVLDGAVIGSGCIVSAGSVVAKGYLEPFGIYGGVPAKLIKSRLDS